MASMGTGSTQLDRYLRTLHLRLTAARTLERAGAGVLIACGLALLMLPALAMRAQPALIPVLGVLACGAIGGAVWGWLGRPTRLDAAMEADRQLHLHDLLSTALLMDNQQADDPWAKSVLAMARGHVAGSASSAVLLRRWGVRAWGGVGLASVLVMTLALFVSSPDSLRASAPRPASSALGIASTQNDDPRSVAPLLKEVRLDTVQTQTPESESPRASGTESTAAAAEGDSSSARSSSPASTPGSGQGSAQTPAAQNGQPAQTPSAVRGHDDRSGISSGGTGSPMNTSVTGPSGGSGFSAGGSAATMNVPPWKADGWSTARQSALIKLQSGELPAAYREMVREYFARP